MDVHAGTLFEWPVAARVYECREYRPEDNVAVANWRESVAGSELAGEVHVVDAMDQIAELRDEFEPEARKAGTSSDGSGRSSGSSTGAGCWTSKRSSTRPRHPRSTGTTRPFRRSSRRRSPTNSSRSRWRPRTRSAESQTVTTRRRSASSCSTTWTNHSRGTINMGNDKTGAYAAAELGSKLRGEDPGENVRSFAGLVDDRRTLRLLNYYDGLIETADRRHGDRPSHHSERRDADNRRGGQTRERLANEVCDRAHRSGTRRRRSLRGRGRGAHPRGRGGSRRSRSTSRADPIRESRAPRIRRRQRQVDRGGRLQRIDRHGRDVSRARGERVRDRDGWTTTRRATTCSTRTA